MPLTSVCKYHLAGSSAVAFGPCGYPGCTAPVANMKLLSKEHDALCPLHVSASSLQNSDERMQSASRFFQKQPGPGDHQLDALVMGTCDELVRHYARTETCFLSSAFRRKSQKQIFAVMKWLRRSSQLVELTLMHV